MQDSDRDLRPRVAYDLSYISIQFPTRNSFDLTPIPQERIRVMDRLLYTLLRDS